MLTRLGSRQATPASPRLRGSSPLTAGVAVGVSMLLAAIMLVAAPAVAVPASQTALPQVSCDSLGSISELRQERRQARRALRKAKKQVRKLVKRHRQLHQQNKVHRHQRLKRRTQKLRQKRKKARQQFRRIKQRVNPQIRQLRSQRRTCTRPASHGGPNRNDAADSGGAPRSHDVELAEVGYEVDALQSVLQVESAKMWDPVQLVTFLDALFPGAAQIVDPDIVEEIFGGYTQGAGALGTERLHELLGGYLTPVQITELIDGLETGGVELPIVSRLAEAIKGQLNASGLLPAELSFGQSGFTADPVSELLAAISGALDTSALGSIVRFLATITGVGPENTTDMATLLQALVPEGLGEFSPTQIDGISAGFSRGLPGADQLSRFLGGVLSPNDVQRVIEHDGEMELLDTAGALSVGQLVATVTGEAPPATSPQASQSAGLFDMVVEIFTAPADFLLSWALGGGAGSPCAWLSLFLPRC